MFLKAENFHLTGRKMESYEGIKSFESECDFYTHFSDHHNRRLKSIHNSTTVEK